MSEGNICVFTERGLVFKSMGVMDTKRLIQCVEELKQGRKSDTEYRFVIEFEDGREVQAKDVWVEVGVSIN